VIDTTEQRARARVVLLSAADLYRARRGTLAQCIVLAAPDIIEAEFARRVLRGVLWDNDLPGWESHPARRRAEVWTVLKTAIRWCSRKAGGWRVNGKDRPYVARVPPSRQWLEWLPR